MEALVLDNASLLALEPISHTMLSRYFKRVAELQDGRVLLIFLDLASSPKTEWPQLTVEQVNRAFAIRRPPSPSQVDTGRPFPATSGHWIDKHDRQPSNLYQEGNQLTRFGRTFCKT